MDDSKTATASAIGVKHIAEEALILENLNSDEVKRLIPTIVFLLITCVVGVIGNSVVIHVYRTKYKMSNTKCFILCLSAVDLLTCCIAVPLDVSTTLEQYTFEHLWLCKMSRVFNTLGTISSAFILLFIAVDRYRKVCKPFEWQIKIKFAKFLCGLAIFLGVMVSWPAIFIYGKKTFDIPKHNVTGSECSTADEILTTKFPLMYSIAFGLLFVGGIIEMSVIYCFIGLKVRRQTQKMHKLLGRVSSIPITASGSDTEASKVDGEQVTKVLETDKTDNNRSALHGDSRETDEQKVKDKNTSEHFYAACTGSQEMEKKQESLKDTGIQLLDMDSNRMEEKDKNIKKEVPESDITDINKTAYRYQSESRTVLQRKTTEEITDKISSTSSDKIIQFPNTIIRRLSAISNRITDMLSRMASITSSNMDADIGTFRKTQFSKQAQARKTALIMFIITFGFIVSFLPHLVLILARQMSSDFVKNMSDTNKAVYKFFLRSFFLNSAINPILYSIFDSTFKLACKQMFLRLCRRGSQSNV